MACSKPVLPSQSDDDDNVPDTIAMARLARKNQGSLEFEYCYGGELDLHRHLSTCPKNPNHLKFIAVHEFTKDHLPSGYQDDVLAKCILALAELTVRVVTKFVSPDRPETFPDNERPYPLREDRGKTLKTCGSGWILNVNREPCPKKKFCPCHECCQSQTPQTNYVEVEIRTAAHQVYDRSEAEHTTCDLFYDKGVVPGKDTVTLTSCWITQVERDFEGDMCDLTYVTHDFNLADRLEEAVSEYESLHRNVKYKYSSNGPKSQSLANNDERLFNEQRDDHKLTMIVSHPHGCSKYITVGKYVKINTMECRNSLTQYFYTTPTCPGSSGAPVFVLDRSWLWLLCEHPHSGHCAPDALNYSRNCENDTDLSYSGNCEKDTDLNYSGNCENDTDLNYSGNCEKDTDLNYSDNCENDTDLNYSGNLEKYTDLNYSGYALG